MYDNNDLNNQTFGEGGEQNTHTPPEPQYVTYVPYGLTPETFEERRQIKKTGNLIGGSVLIMLGVSGVLSLLLTLILGFLGFSSENIYNILKDAAVNKAFQIAASALLFTLPFILVFKCSGYKIRELVNFDKPDKKLVIPLFLMGISFCAFSNIAVSVSSSLFQSFGINYEVDFGEDPKGLFGFLLTLIATAVIPPLVEEFACRGLILGVLRKFGDGFAIITSSIVFGLLHGNFEQIPFAFLVGLVLAYITVKSGSLWIAVAVHAFNNLIAVIFTSLEAVIPQTVGNVCYTFLLVILMLLGLLSLILFKKNNISYSIEKSETKANEKQKYKWFFGSAAIIIFIVIAVLESMAYFL